MDTPTCTARILAWPPRLDASGIAGVADCDRPARHTHAFHEGPIASHDLPARLSWLDFDRRTFRGALVLCDTPRCVYPADHRGDCAL